MTPVERHAHAPDASFDGGDLDCGNGLLLLIRRHIDPLPRGGLLEIRSSEVSVDEDLPAWCRMTGNELVSLVRRGRERSFLVCKGAFAERGRAPSASPTSRHAAPPAVADVSVPPPAAAPWPVPALAVSGIGSWPRPAWLLRALHERLEGRLPEADFEAAADDAVRLALAAQERAGVDVVTDGEQRRDSYSSFVGTRLEGVQLIPLTDLLPLVDDPDKFAAEMASLDVPASEVRHPAVLDRLARTRPIAGHELAFLRTLSQRPVKVALPGPYLLLRTMWIECIPERAYRRRDELARDIVRVLREEVAALLAAGASLVQLDEPVLTEVVFTGAKRSRSFMCGALSEKSTAEEELALARRVLHDVLAGLPRERLALHVCRGNWSKDERVALAGDYGPLLSLLAEAPVGTLFLELATPRAGELDVLRELPRSLRVGVGLVNQKLDRVEDRDEVLARARRAVDIFGVERMLLTPDCGFATFADSPVASAQVAEAKLRALADVAAVLRRG